MKYFLIAATWLVGVLLLAGPVPAQTGAAATVTLQGDISIEDEDDNGNVTKISFVYWDDAGEYRMCLIAPGAKAKELYKHIDKTVNIVCTQSTDAEGVCTVNIKSYEIVESPAMEEDEEVPAE